MLGAAGSVEVGMMEKAYSTAGGKGSNEGLPPPADVLVPTHPMPKEAAAAATLAKKKKKDVAGNRGGSAKEEEAGWDVGALVVSGYEGLAAATDAPLWVERWDVPFLTGGSARRREFEATYHKRDAPQPPLQQVKGGKKRKAPDGVGGSDEEAAANGDGNSQNERRVLAVNHGQSKFHSLVMHPVSVKVYRFV